MLHGGRNTLSSERCKVFSEKYVMEKHETHEYVKVTLHREFKKKEVIMPCTTAY